MCGAAAAPKSERMATDEQISRLHAVVPAAQASMRRWGVPASVTLAQWTLESGWGSSKLSTSANNYFGVKAEHTENPSTYVEFRTEEFAGGKAKMEVADFEKYADAAGSFDDHGRLLAAASRYRVAMMHRDDPDTFALWLQKATYSTSPTYAAALQRIMRLYDLKQYDTLPPAPAVAAQEVAA
jgi:flagellum-specific peptidoglycan hydrolase FlgJ